MSGTRQRLTAAERREQIVAVALRHFAEGGLHGTVAANVLALERGASVFRVHDVRASRDALLVVAATFGGRWPTTPTTTT